MKGPDSEPTKSTRNLRACVMQENSGSTTGDGPRVPQPNVPTGALPVPVMDSGRSLFSAADLELGFTRQSQPMHHPGVMHSMDEHVRTNEGLANFQPADSGKIFTGFTIVRSFIDSICCH